MNLSEIYSKVDVNLSEEIKGNIVRDFFREVMRKVVSEGMRFEYPGLGTIKVFRKNRVKATVDFPATRKAKAEVLARGGTIYEVLERDEKGNITKDNGGEKYMVFDTSPYYYVFNIGKRCYLGYDTHTYKYKPSIAKEGCVKLLSKFVKENPIKAQLMYS